VATGEERTLTTLNETYGSRKLEWLPDGRSLMVHDRIGNRSRVRQVGIESGDPKMLFEGPYGIWTTALSIDGKSLFYSVREPGTADVGTLRLVKRRLESGEEAELYRTESPGAGLFGLCISPDGTRLAFSVNVDYNQRAVMIIPAAGGAAREIRRSGYDALAPLPQGAMSWTKDGRHLIVTVKRGPGDEQLAAIPTDGGEIRLLSLRMPTLSTRTVSADGRRLAFTGSTSKQELWVIRNLLSEPAKAR